MSASESRPMRNRQRERSSGRWWTEWISEDILEAYRVREVVHEELTPYQRLSILDTEPFGKCLLLDGKMQSSLLDEHIYHETLVHPAMVMHGTPKRVAVIGGGEGSTVREAARWKTVEEIYMIDLDQRVVELCRSHLPQLSSNVYEDARVKLVYEDGRKWLERWDGKALDVIIVDVTDPLEGGPSYLLYTEEFYKLAWSKLSDRGVLATQATSPVHNPFSFHSIRLTASNVFPRVSELVCFMISFSGPWGFIYGSGSGDVAHLEKQDVDRILRAANVSGLKFYSGAVHRALVELTRHYIGLRPASPRIIRDSAPIFIK